MALTLSLTTVQQILTAQPLLSSASNMTSAQIYLMAAQEEAKIWARLAVRYAVPIAPIPPAIEAIGVDLAIYSLLTKQALLANTLGDSPWPKAYKEAWELIEDIANGDASLVNASGQLIEESSLSQTTFFSTGDYKPTFTELPIDEAQVDPDKLDDLRAERGL